MSDDLSDELDAYLRAERDWAFAHEAEKVMRGRMNKAARRIRTACTKAGLDWREATHQRRLDHFSKKINIDDSDPARGQS